MASEDETREFLDRAVTVGSKVVGGLIGAGATLGTASPFVGAALSPFIAHGLERVGKELISRRLAPRQEARVSRLIAVAAICISERQAQGEIPREDGFFETVGETDRSPSDEISEAALLAAMNSSEERKIDFIAQLLANIAFDQSINESTAHLLIQTAEKCSYRGFILLELLAQTDALGLQRRPHGDAPDTPAELAPLAVELYGLLRDGLIEMKDSEADRDRYAVLGMDEIDPSRMYLTPFGRLLQANLELGRISFELPAVQVTLTELRQLSTSRIGSATIDGGSA